MPIFAPALSSTLDQKQFGELDYCVMRHVFECQNELGRLCDEAIYQNDLAARLESAGIPAQKEVKLIVQHRDFEKTYWLDLLAANAAIYELKTHSVLVGEHEAQLLNYLLLCECNHGKLINFRPNQVETKFVNCPITHEARSKFRIDTESWQEHTARDTQFRARMIDLLNDWGNSLDLLLYTEAMIHLLGGEDQTSQLVPLSRNGKLLGNQRLCLLSPDSAFRITALNGEIEVHRKNLLSLLRLSPLQRIQWVNLGRHRVHFITVSEKSKKFGQKNISMT